MGAYERPGESDEWYTPAYIFDALGERFDLDVAAPPAGRGTSRQTHGCPICR